jgi:hypothetical protein
MVQFSKAMNQHARHKELHPYKTELSKTLLCP